MTKDSTFTLFKISIAIAFFIIITSTGQVTAAQQLTPLDQRQVRESGSQREPDVYSTSTFTQIPFVVQSASQQQQETVIVHMFKADYLQVADLIQPILFIDYDSFVWLELSEEDLATLEESGVNFGQREDANLLFLSPFQFDPLEGEPQLPPEQQTTYEPGENGFHLVQFFGPTKDEWLEEIQAVGAIVIQYQPNHAYIVRLTPEEAALVDELDFVRWVGVYHAAYRIAPLLLELRDAEQVIENIDLTIFNDGQVQETITAVQELGGEFIQMFPAMPDDSLITAIFALPSDALVDVAQINTVLWMNFSSPEPGLDDEVSDQIVVGNHVGGIPFPGYNNWLTNNGINGTGVTVAVVDTGMDTNNNATAHLDIRGRIAAFVAYPGAPATDTNGHGTHVGGVIAGNASIGTVDPNGFLYGLGVAPNAQLVVQNALSGSLWPPAGGWQLLSRDSVVNGAVASNNSWWTGVSNTPGYTATERTHDIMVRDADWTTTALAEPLIMVFSAGNAGSGASTITEPKEAKNLIVVGASENFRSDPWVTAGPCGNPNNINNITNFSSRGPALDGRILPNVTAPGTFIASLRSATGSFGGLACSGVIDTNYVWFSGTSQAAPHGTGIVALITQWWRAFNAGANPSPAMAKALLINGATDMPPADIPNNNEGWGRMNLNNIIAPTVPVIYNDQNTTFDTTGQTWSITVSPSDPAQPLKATLVWSDAPGPGRGSKDLVNDLDLTVTQGTTTFLGNVFSSGWSTSGGAADTLNNIENVYIQSPAGIYTITVNATEIDGDGVPQNAGLTDQDFAFVCSNCATPADLSITKTDSPDPVTAGNNLTYTLTITNNGPGDATGVMVTDTLPAGVTLVSVIPSQGTCFGSVDCDLGSLANGASATITIVVTVDPTAPCGTITNTANVTGNETDPNTGDNTATEDTTVLCPVDLSITKSDSTDPVTAGGSLTYTLTVTNNGPNDATGVMVTDTLPAGVTLVSATPSQGTCSGSVDCDLGNLVNGASALITIVVTVDPAAPCGTITNSASVAGSEVDPNTGDNTASEDTIVNCLVDLSITKSDSPDPVTAGDNLTYTLTITNNGPGDATGVMVTDILPAGITLVSVIPSQGTCFGSVDCDLGSLANGASATITIEVIVPPATPSGTITNSASVAGNETDPNIADNTSSEGTTVIGLADLSITKSDSPDPVTAGDILTYTLSVTNNGPGDATGVTITDTLPTGVMFTSATSGCTEAGGTVTCSLGNLANGASVTITIEVSTDPTHPGGTVTNTASVAGNEMDLNTGDNNASEDTTVRFLVQIDISPGDTNNIINPTSKGRVSVAILSTPGFDAPNAVDQSTLTFGRTGNEASLYACKSLARDVNGDGLLDLICGFYIQLTDFQIGDTEGILRGETMAGVPFEGRDSVMVVLPRPRR